MKKCRITRHVALFLRENRTEYEELILINNPNDIKLTFECDVSEIL